MDDFTQGQIHGMAQRIAVLEAQQKSTDKAIADIQEAAEDIKGEVGETSRKVDALLNKLSKWEGRLGMLIFIGSCLWTFLITMWGSILAFLKFHLMGNPPT